MNLGELQSEIGRLLGDANNQRWNTDVLTFRINQAQMIVNGYTNAVKTKETLTPVAGVATVTLDADTMDIVRVVRIDSVGNRWELDGITRESLDFDYPNWDNWQNGEPRLYFYDATNQQINLVPPPDSGNAVTNGLEVWEIRKPADLVNASDIPFDSNNQMIPYHLAVVHWVVAQCFMDDETPESLAKSRFHKSGVFATNGAGEFEKQVMRIMSKFDSPEDVPDTIKWRPTGGRVGSTNFPTKGNPFAGL